MRKFILIVMLALLALSFALPANSAPPDKGDDAKLHIFVHYPKPGKAPTLPGTCDPTSTDPTHFGLTGWVLSGPTVYRVNYNTIPNSVANPRDAIRNSFATWQTASSVSLSEGVQTTARGAKRDGQNVVVWGAVPGGAIAVTYIWASGGKVVEVDTVMGKSLPWAYTSVRNPDAACGYLHAYDVQDILTHEIGHWLGLDDLYSKNGYDDHDLTMYGYGDKGELKKDTLAPGDTAGIGALYNKK